MRRLLILLLLLPVVAEAAPPSRTQTYTNGQVINPSHVTENEDNIYTYLQAGVDRVANNSVERADIQNAAINADKIDTGAVTSTGILNGTIVNEDINASAAIDATKLSISNAIGAAEIDETENYTWTGTHDFGGANIEVKNTTDCSAVATTGQLCWDSDDNLMYVGDGSAPPALVASGGTPNLTLSTSNSAGSATSFVRTDATILTFDATAPASIDNSDTGSAGAASTAARRDHQHAVSLVEKSIVFLHGSMSASSSTTFMGTGFASTTEASAAQKAPYAGTAGGYNVWMSTNQPDNLTVDVMINGSSIGSASYTAGQSGWKTISGTDAVASGNTLSIKVTPTGSVTANFMASFYIEASQ